MGATEDCGAECNEADLETYPEFTNRKKNNTDQFKQKTGSQGHFQGLPAGQVPRRPVKSLSILCQEQGAASFSLTGAVPVLPI